MKKVITRITLKDIAQATGFTVNTISHALNDKKDISEATKEIIRNKAYELGYMKNTVASSLRTGYTRTIAVIVSDIANPLFGALAKYIEKYAALNGYNTIIFNTDEDPKVEELSILSALEKTVDGIIFCPSQRLLKPIKLLRESKCPFVLLGRHFKQYKTDYVISDDINGAFLAVDHLITYYKCKEILFLNGSKYISSAQDRLLGYKAALEKHNIPFNNSLVKQFDVITNGRPGNQIKDIDVSFDGVFAFSDLIALRILSYWREQKLDLFNSIPIVGYDNIEKDMPIPYPLSSIDYSKQHMANILVDILIKKIKDPEAAIVQEKIPTRLVSRF